MEQFARLSGDRSAIHSNSSVAQDLGFDGRIQYGFLLAALLSGIVGKYLENAVCAAVNLDFVRPVIAGETVDCRAEVVQIQSALRTAALKINMLRGDDIVIRGKLTVQFLLSK